ncbi:hypothetical protein A8990_12729 [Paenibacillus taihuensis]|uniref:Uncharacterized protein n=1 Tax=Paenibacillus taihuensis TaxID=1156355 RepID=A0A3D9RNL0_9BACL|nr:hypothetical protein A8990_12729 [Paenibacillus taihuensis]
MVVNKTAYNPEKERSKKVLDTAKKLLTEKKKQPFFYKYFRLHPKTKPRW